MIYSLKGKLILSQSNVAVVECAGVGYKCFVSNSTASSLPIVGDEVRLFTYMNVKEDAVDLYGFSNHDELSCFKMLISISGIGAKVALSILSTHTPDKIAMAIAGGDDKLLAMSPGVGKKTAQRIILELKDKISKITDISTSVSSGLVGQPNASTNIAQAINALTVLGYSTKEIMPIITKFDSKLSTEELIQLSLKEFGGAN